jgi:tripartite-type tricarboxylate transporter receptor subunit TctC
VVRELNVVINKALADPMLRERLAEQGGTVVGGTTEQFAAFVRAETTRWTHVIKDAGIKVED